MARRDSDSRHHRSRLDREPSPKRVRRDGKTRERTARDFVDRDQKHHRRLQDSHLLVVPDSKIKTVSVNKESGKKSNGYREGTKISSDNIEAPRSRSLFQQHDERARQVGRSFRPRETTERESWRDSKDRERGRATNRISNNDNDNDTKPKDEAQPSKKRPSFQETKLPVNAAGSGDKSVTTQVTKIPVNDEGSERTEMQRMKFDQSRDYRYGGGSFRGRDRFNGQSGGRRTDKWKHDLYDETNNNSTSNKEEDQIAKVEALLAS